MKKFNDYLETVKYIESLSINGSKGNYMVDRSNPDEYLKRMRHFLELIGNPDKDLKFIHIAGTSGKGSVTNMIHEILLAKGKKVGSFTSPFVTTTIEKFKVGNLYISPKEFIEIVNELKPAINRIYKEGPYGPVSYFEVCLAIAFVYFKKKKCEWVVLEVGLGGRYDATNVIEHPVVTAVTNIDYDHTEILGKTLSKISKDKAGIIKKGSRFFTTEKRGSIRGIFKKICLEKKVLCNILPTYSDHIKNNISLASSIAKYLGVDKKSIEKGIKNARLQCRFETMQLGPMVVIDGAHNRAKTESTISNLKKLKFNKLHIIVAISANKDHLSILKQLAPKADYFYSTKFKNTFRKCAEPESLISLSLKHFKKGCKYDLYKDASNALKDALKNAGKDDLILVTGSFFLAGEIRKLWITEEWILRNKVAFKKNIT